MHLRLVTEMAGFSTRTASTASASTTSRNLLWQVEHAVLGTLIGYINPRSWTRSHLTIQTSKSVRITIALSDVKWCRFREVKP